MRGTSHFAAKAGVAESVTTVRRCVRLKPSITRAKEIEAVAQNRQQYLPFRREQHLTRAPFEQAYADRFLQLPHLMTDRRRRDVQFVRCALEAQMSRGGLERAQANQWRQTSHCYGL